MGEEVYAVTKRKETEFSKIVHLLIYTYSTIYIQYRSLEFCLVLVSVQYSVIILGLEDPGRSTDGVPPSYREDEVRWYQKLLIFFNISIKDVICKVFRKTLGLSFLILAKNYNIGYG